jgi:uncharacterized protein (TIGR00255 family)
MIHSMTGYGKAEGEGKDHRFTVELRTLNSKGFDFNFRAPSLLRPMENDLRKLLQNTLERGKVDVQVTVTSVRDALENTLDTARLEVYVKAFQNVLEQTGASGDALNAAMRMPDMNLTGEQSLSDEDADVLVRITGEACDQLSQFRASEGAAMESDLKNAIAKIGALLEAVIPFEEERVERLRSKITAALEILTVDFNRDRFEQEMIYFLEKLDINEEKVRLKQHLEYFVEEMGGKQKSGRKLNFIAQEMGREINTLGSKCQHEGIQKLVVDMKDTLEQIKEIILNIV